MLKIWLERAAKGCTYRRQAGKVGVTSTAKSGTCVEDKGPRKSVVHLKLHSTVRHERNVPGRACHEEPLRNEKRGRPFRKDSHDERDNWSPEVFRSISKVARFADGNNQGTVSGRIRGPPSRLRKKVQSALTEAS